MARPPHASLWPLKIIAASLTTFGLTLCPRIRVHFRIASCYKIISRTSWTSISPPLPYTSRLLDLKQDKTLLIEGHARFCLEIIFEDKKDNPIGKLANPLPNLDRQYVQHMD